MNTFEIDQYHTIKLLRSTILGDVFLGEDSEGLRVEICIYNKSRLRPIHFDGQEQSQIGLLRGLEDFNQTKILSYGRTFFKNVDYFYLIRKPASGELLTSYIKRMKGLMPYDALTRMVDLLGHLDEVHKKGYVLNGIRPNGVRLLEGKIISAEIIEFENSFRIGASDSKIISSDIPIYFLPPEYENGIINHQSDLYSMAALMYFMIEGVPPWNKEFDENLSLKDQLAELNEVRQSALTFSSDILSSTDAHYRATLVKALSFDTNERFKNCEEFLIALKREKVLAVDKLNSGSKEFTKKKGPGFDAIAGMDYLKAILKNDVINVILQKEKYAKYNLGMLNGILLYGPPGCGKTFIAERFAEEVGFCFMSLKPSDLKSKYINETEQKIAEIFDNARANAPSVLFIDEANSIAPNRDQGLHQMHSSAVDELLAQLSNIGESDVFVIAATNKPDLIDPAILRRGRIDKVIYVSPPDLQARCEMFKLYLLTRPMELNIDFEKLGELTATFVSSDIKYLVDEASRIALQNESLISQGLLEMVINSSKSSLKEDDLKKYLSMKDHLEGVSENSSKNAIGFTIGKTNKSNNE